MAIKIGNNPKNNLIKPLNAGGAIFLRLFLLAPLLLRQANSLNRAQARRADINIVLE